MLVYQRVKMIYEFPNGTSTTLMEIQAYTGYTWIYNNDARSSNVACLPLTNYNDGIYIMMVLNDTGYIYIYCIYIHTVLLYRKPVSGIDVINVKKHH